MPSLYYFSKKKFVVKRKLLKFTAVKRGDTEGKSLHQEIM